MKIKTQLFHLGRNWGTIGSTFCNLKIKNQAPRWTEQYGASWIIHILTVLWPKCSKLPMCMELLLPASIKWDQAKYLVLFKATVPIFDTQWTVNVWGEKETTMNMCHLTLHKTHHITISFDFHTFQMILRESRARTVSTFKWGNWSCKIFSGSYRQ